MSIQNTVLNNPFVSGFRILYIFLHCLCVLSLVDDTVEGKENEECEDVRSLSHAEDGERPLVLFLIFAHNVT